MTQASALLAKIEEAKRERNPAPNLSISSTHLKSWAKTARNVARTYTGRDSKTYPAELLRRLAKELASAAQGSGKVSAITLERWVEIIRELQGKLKTSSRVADLRRIAEPLLQWYDDYKASQ